MEQEVEPDVDVCCVLASAKTAFFPFCLRSRSESGSGPGVPGIPGGSGSGDRGSGVLRKRVQVSCYDGDLLRHPGPHVPGPGAGGVTPRPGPIPLSDFFPRPGSALI